MLVTAAVFWSWVLGMLLNHMGFFFLALKHTDGRFLGCYVKYFFAE